MSARDQTSQPLGGKHHAFRVQHIQIQPSGAVLLTVPYRDAGGGCGPHRSTHIRKRRWALPRLYATTDHGDDALPVRSMVGFRGSGEAFDDGTLGLGGPIKATTTELRRQIPGISIGTSAVSYPAVPWLIPFTLNSAWALYASVAYTAAAVFKNLVGNQYADSVATGANDGSSDITHLAVRCPTTKIVVAGYSQGGQALRAALRKLNNTTASHVRAVVLFGDAGFIPQEPGVSVIGDPQRQGKGIGVLNLGTAPLGSRFAGRVLSDCKDTDPVCQASYSNLYTIGVHLTYGSSSDAFLVASWLKNILYPTVTVSHAPCETLVADTTIPDGTVLGGRLQCY